MLNVISIDLEEWFCVSNFENVIRREDWDSLESRVESSTRTILELFERYDVKATFFVLGWVAERHPELIREIADRGHEIACHGFGHRLVYDQSPPEFIEDLGRSLTLIREITGVECRGFRAPSFSLRRDMSWAWDCLADQGILYDSSIFPVTHDRYGEPDAPRAPYVIGDTGHSLIEFPPSTVSIMGRNLPVAGGGYFRLYPLAITRWAVRRLESEGLPTVIYLHPWEFDPDHPKPNVSRKTLARHRVGLGSVTSKLAELLKAFEFGTMRESLRSLGYELK